MHELLYQPDLVPFCRPNTGICPVSRWVFFFCASYTWVGFKNGAITAGYNVHDYGDLQWEEVPDDPPSYNIKYPRSIGAATKKVRLIFFFMNTLKKQE